MGRSAAVRRKIIALVYEMAQWPSIPATWEAEAVRFEVSLVYTANSNLGSALVSRRIKKKGGKEKQEENGLVKSTL